MTVEQAFEIWKSDSHNKGHTCKYGEYWSLDFFGKCNQPNHEDVNHMEKSCPSNCKDFEYNKKRAKSAFYALYEESPWYYNEEYGIEPDCLGYIPSEKPEAVEKPEPEIVTHSEVITEDERFCCSNCKNPVKLLNTFCETCGCVLDWKNIIENKQYRIQVYLP